MIIVFSVRPEAKNWRATQENQGGADAVHKSRLDMPYFCSFLAVDGQAAPRAPRPHAAPVTARQMTYASRHDGGR